MELIQSTSKDGTMVLKSPQLDVAGFNHAFSTRVGPNGEDFDLSRPGFSRIQTPPAACKRNLDLFCHHIISDSKPQLNTPRQMHGVEVADAREADMQEADAVISDDVGYLAGIRTADCMGVLIACPRTGIVAAVHAGGRGLVGDIPGHAIENLRGRSKSHPSEMIAALGPCIGAEVYEVGPDVAEQFTAAGLGECVLPPQKNLRRRNHVDVHAAARLRLINAGISREKIDGKPLCTSNNELFYSYRNEGAECGRLMAVICPT